jgi:uncharacterized protein (TIGR01777 family)
MATTRILVSGASGTIGRELLVLLKSRGYEVFTLSRRGSGERTIQWDTNGSLSPAFVSGFDAVVHLAGESIVGRWTNDKKQKIQDSRVQGTRHLSEALAKAPQRPNVFIVASAIGYYGDRGNENLREQSPAGQGFLPEVCKQWEAAAQAAADAGIRTAHTRFGIVLSKKGGALPAMLTPFKLGLGGRVGTGKQYWSWIHVQDVASAILHLMKTDLLQGAVNCVAPKPVTNTEFTRVLASVLARPAIFPLPAFAARLALGEMADELLLASQKVEPAKLISSGYPFRYPELRPALQDVLKG